MEKKVYIALLCSSFFFFFAKAYFLYSLKTNEICFIGLQAEIYGNYFDFIFKSLQLISEYKLLNWLHLYRDRTMDQGKRQPFLRIFFSKYRPILTIFGCSYKICMANTCKFGKFWKKEPMFKDIFCKNGTYIYGWVQCSFNWWWQRRKYYNTCMWFVSQKARLSKKNHGSS